MKDAIQLAKDAGAEYGRTEAVMFLFAGAVDNDAIMVLSERLMAGDQAAFESLPKPQECNEGLYAPNLIALDRQLNTGIESPYSWYLEVCDAYDTAFNKAVTDHIYTVAHAIREGIM